MNPLRSFVLSVTLSLLVFGCRELPTQNQRTDPAGVGQVAFSLAKSAIPNDVARVVATLTRSGYATIQDSVDVVSTRDTLKMVIGNIPAGTWNLLMVAKDFYGVVRYSGSAAVTLVDGQITMVTIQMNATPQGGTLQINVVWPISQTSWQMYPSNPVLKQASGFPDADYYYIQTPCVLKINGVYRMWYTAGYSPSINGIDSAWIATAISADGVQWTKLGPIQLKGSIPTWMNQGAYHPTVLFENGSYRLWFTAGNYISRYNGIGSATSSDGFAWKVAPDRVVSVDSVRSQILGPSIIAANGTYYLYYSALNKLSGTSLWELFLSLSYDGQSWLEKGRVLPVRQTISWEQGGIFVPSVIFDGNKFSMYYTAGGPSNSIGLATSTDGTVWARSASPELDVRSALPWSISHISYPSVVRDGSKLKMWFSGLSAIDNRWQIGYAEK